MNTIGKVYAKRKEYRRELYSETGDVWSVVTGESIRFRDRQPHTLPDYEGALRKKWKKYQREGYKSLISGKFMNQNRRIVTIDMELFLNNLFADRQKKPTMADITGMYSGF
ncbi:MAG: hypothetical protein LBG92_10435, partial [Prevotellaceae bacterium]|nr:hypothetical protein [Prevotellaceae bacterium]